MPQQSDPLLQPPLLPTRSGSNPEPHRRRAAPAPCWLWPGRSAVRPASGAGSSFSSGRRSGPGTPASRRAGSPLRPGTVAAAPPARRFRPAAARRIEDRFILGPSVQPLLQAFARLVGLSVAERGVPPHGEFLDLLRVHGSLLVQVTELGRGASSARLPSPWPRESRAWARW